MNDIYLCRWPAVKVVIIMMGGLIFAAHVTLPLKLTITLVACLFLLLIALIVADRSKSPAIDFLLSGFIFITSVFHYQAASSIFSANHIKFVSGVKEDVFIDGYICKNPVYKDSLLSCELQTEKIQLAGSGPLETTGKILLKSTVVPESLSKGDRVSVIGILKKPAGERNPGEFNYRKYLESRNIYGIISVYDSAKITIIKNAKEFPWWEKTLTACRGFLEGKIDNGFTGQNRAFLKGLILGERDEIIPEVKEAFSKTGVMHVLAVSGLHVGFIVLIFSGVFKLLRLRFRITTILTMISVLFYMILIGFKPPVVRATILVELYFLSTLIQRPANIYNLVSVAAILILIIDPLQLFQPSFQLSFVAVLSIIYFYKIMNARLQKYKYFQTLSRYWLSNYIIQLFLVSLAASCGTLPLTVYYFEKLPVFTWFLNIIVIPVVGFIIGFGFLFILVSAFVWSAAAFLAQVLQKVIEILINFIESIAELPFSYIPVYQAKLAHIVAAYIFLILIFNLDKPRIRRTCVAIFVSILFVVSFHGLAARHECLNIIFFDVGQGDAAFIQFPDGKNMLIDGGACNDFSNAGQRHVIPYLKRQGVRRIDVLALTHADNDHIGGFPYILRHIKVARVIDTGYAADHEFYRDYRHLIDSLNIKYRAVKAGEIVLEAHKYGVFVFNPDDSLQYNDINNASLVLKVIYGDVSFLFTGDIEGQAEEHLLRYADALQCDVLKVAHHGSKTSSIEEFLRYTNPAFAVISVGAYNRFNHPSTLVIDRFKKYGTQIIRTDENGAVIFKSDGKSIKRLR